MRAGTWFVEQSDDTFIPAYEHDGPWYAWTDNHELTKGVAWHTAAATLDNLPTVGQAVIALQDAPNSEADSLGKPWDKLTMQFLDDQQQRINTRVGWLPLDQVRVKLDSHFIG